MQVHKQPKKYTESAQTFLEESRAVMFYLTITEYLEILFCSILVMRGKTGRELPSSPKSQFTGKISANIFASITYQ